MKAWAGPIPNCLSSETRPIRNGISKAAIVCFKFDGILFHDAKTCPNNSNNRYGMPERLAKKLGIATLTINGDLCDLRCYSEEQAKTQIEAFIEQLEER